MLENLAGQRGLLHATAVEVADASTDASDAAEHEAVADFVQPFIDVTTQADTMHFVALSL